MELGVLKHCMPEILIIDYGVGNIESVTTALDALRVRYRVSSSPQAIAEARAYILPGVGAFAEAMHNLESRGLVEPLRREVMQNGKPLLGICLGMQVLAEDSTEYGSHKGLGFIPGHVVRIEEQDQFPVPHVGWNQLSLKQREPLFAKLDDGVQFYFDHSYHFQTSSECVAATTEYGSEITAAVQRGNVFGVQFHPEKSQTSGLRLIRAFTDYVFHHVV